MEEKEKKDWLTWIDIQLEKLIDRDVIEPEDKNMYLKLDSMFPIS